MFATLLGYVDSKADHVFDILWKAREIRFSAANPGDRPDGGAIHTLYA
jgi:hypothetical protein